MRVLGISAYYHDGSAALVEDGRVVAAAAEERFSRIKHDQSFPRLAADFCLAQAGVSSQDLDAVVYYEQPSTKFTRVLASTLAGFPGSRRAFVHGMQSWLAKKLWTENEVGRTLNVHPRRVQCLPHHLSHAAQAFLASPFREAAILTVDAVGEWNCTSLYHGTREPELSIRHIESIPYPHSLGLIYAAFTAFLGFKPNDAECSTMALAAFGRPTYADQVRRIVRVASDGSYELDPSYFQFISLTESPFRPELLRLLGEPRDPRQPLPFRADPAGKGETPSRDEQRFADVAASVQLVLEEALLALARRLHRATSSTNLCLAGGVALNCVANRRLQAEGPFARVFVPPDPGDGGAALGAAQYVAASSNGAGAASLSEPFLGKRYAPDDALALVASLPAGSWVKHRLAGIAARPSDALHVERFDSRERLVDRTADALAGGQIVGWFQGRFELGPRALGNRSLLVDPRDRAAAQRLSRLVKQRSAFRPYAISVTEEDALRVFGWGPDQVPLTARWMQTSAEVQTSARESLAAAMHVDGTTRPQVCSRAQNPEYHALLDAFGKRSGLGALLNTSFNDRGAPLVSSPYEALLMFLRTDMDLLVLEDAMIRKESR